jgi:hypothetical protein
MRASYATFRCVHRTSAITATLLVSLVALVALLASGAACGTSDAGPSTTAIACEPGDATVPSGTTLVTENSSGTCPTAPVALRGTGLPGTPCQSDTDCAPSCCACGKKGTSALVASCAGGMCGSVNQLCCGYSATPTCM